MTTEIHFNGPRYTLTDADKRIIRKYSCSDEVRTLFELSANLDEIVDHNICVLCPFDLQLIDSFSVHDRNRFVSTLLNSPDVFTHRRVLYSMVTAGTYRWWLL